MEGSESRASPRMTTSYSRNRSCGCSVPWGDDDCRALKLGPRSGAQKRVPGSFPWVPDALRRGSLHQNIDDKVSACSEGGREGGPDEAAGRKPFLHSFVRFCGILGGTY